MNRCWFILLDNQQSGPFSYEELKTISSLTPDTLVWKEELENWTPIRNVPELKDLFKNEEPKVDENEEEVSSTIPQDEIALPLNHAEPPLLFWLMIALVVIVYVFFRLSQ